MVAFGEPGTDWFADCQYHRILVRAGQASGTEIAAPWAMATNGVLFATRYGTLWIVRLIPILALMGLLLRNANQIQTSRLTQVTGTGMYPDYAPDGQHIAFASITGLFAMRPDGSNLIQLSHEGLGGSVSSAP